MKNNSTDFDDTVFYVTSSLQCVNLNVPVFSLVPVIKDIKNVILFCFMWGYGMFKEDTVLQP